MKFKNPYIIAEISGNHCGSFEKAKKLIKCAKINGADAVKLQTYTADMMTIKSSKSYFKINDGYGICIIKHTHRYPGIQNYSIMQKKLALHYLVHHLVKKLLII